jgi:hypothetical protein
VSGLQRQRFKELVLYIVALSADDDAFGAVKLNKLLFYCDFTAYRELGHALTGAHYQKLPWGPAAIEFLPLQDELLRDGLARVETRDRGGHEQRVTVALQPPELRVFTPDELALVERVVGEMRSQDARSISDLSHAQSAGWQLVDEGQVIPYDTAFISTRRPSPAILEHANALAAERGWAHVQP